MEKGFIKIDFYTLRCKLFMHRALMKKSTVSWNFHIYKPTTLIL